MYKLSVKQWNPFKGCRFKCVYCKPSFQAQSKRWGKKNCPPCYDYTPHPHPERLSEPLPRTRYMQFIFALASSDPAFCPTNYLQQITNRMEKERDKTFLIQSKEPKTFSRVKWPGNIILGTTVETNKDELYKGISQAPLPSVRVAQLAKISHPLKMLTYEPVLDFDVNSMVAYAEAVKPCMIWLGYDSKNCGLPEPSLDKFKELYWELGRRGFTVILKTVRPPIKRSIEQDDLHCLS
jgi:hypothetical protein